jgi:hypothetical protein
VARVEGGQVRDRHATKILIGYDREFGLCDWFASVGDASKKGDIEGPEDDMALRQRALDDALAWVQAEWAAKDAEPRGIDLAPYLAELDKLDWDKINREVRERRQQEQVVRVTGISLKIDKSW